MPTAKQSTTTFTTATIAANARFYTAEIDTSTMEFATIHVLMTHVGAAGGFAVIPIGKMGSSWFPMPSPTVIQGSTGGIQTPITNNPPYTSNFAPNAAFGYARPMAYFISAPSAGQRIGASILVNVQAYTKLVIAIENYASVQNDVTITVGGGSTY